jgi:hypothetical protein
MRAQIIDNLIRLDTLLFHHFNRTDLTEAAAFLRTEHLYFVAHQLHQVLIGTHQPAWNGLLPAYRRQGSDDIVGFKSVKPNHGNTQERQDFFYQRNLGVQILGGGISCRLVFGIHLMPESGTDRIQRHDKTSGRQGSPQGENGPEETMDRRDIVAVPVGQGSINESEISSVDESVAVEQIESVVHVYANKFT